MGRDKKRLLETKDVSVNYGLIRALLSVSIHVGLGEIVCLLGPNAAGKSTLMYAVAGILRVSRGAVLFDGQNIHNLPSERIVKEGITLVPEGRLLFHGMKIYENLELGAYRWYRGGKRKELEKDLEKVFRLFPVLKARRNQQAGMLSGGEQQMVAIGRGLMSRPRMLLLDEPCLGLAPVLVNLVMKTLADLRREHGLTIFFSEQNAAAAVDIADRGYVMGSGQIATEGTGQELEATDAIRRSYFGQ